MHPPSSIGALELWAGCPCAPGYRLRTGCGARLALCCNGLALGFRFGLACFSVNYRYWALTLTKFPVGGSVTVFVQVGLIHGQAGGKHHGSVLPV